MMIRLGFLVVTTYYGSSNTRERHKELEAKSIGKKTANTLLLITFESNVQSFQRKALMEKLESPTLKGK